MGKVDTVVEEDISGLDISVNSVLLVDRHKAIDDVAEIS